MSEDNNKNVYSIEEDIKRLNDLLTFKGKGLEYALDKKSIKAIEHILQDYTRQRQINEEHQKINGELREKVKELESDLYSANCIVKELTEENIKLKVLEDDIKDKRITYIDTPEFEENYIPIQKIKDKIEELNKQEQQLQNSISKEEREEYSDANISFQLCDIEIRKEVLEELLQESEDK